jgi:hypothetical protein
MFLTHYSRHYFILKYNRDLQFVNTLFLFFPTASSIYYFRSDIEFIKFKTAVFTFYDRITPAAHMPILDPQTMI